MLIIEKTPNQQCKKIGGVKTFVNRIWLEGIRLGRYVEIGTKMLIKDSVDGIRVVFNQTDSTRIVSKRTHNGSTLPLIEINESNSDFLKSISPDTLLRIAITTQGITITVNKNVVEARMSERENRLLNKLANNKKIEIGSIFAGGGTLDYMAHKGFEQASLSTVIRLCVDSEESAIENLIDNAGHLFDDRSIFIQSDISILDFTKKMPKLDIFNVTPPCIDACAAGKAKKGNNTETWKTAHLAYYYLQLIDKTNPSYIFLECVTAFSSEPSYMMLTAMLKSWGYDIQTKVIESNKEGYSLESRKRLFMVAVTKGFSATFDINKVHPRCKPFSTLGDILDKVPDDHKCWSPKTGLLLKESRDAEKGNGFRMQVFTQSDSYIGTLRAMYQKSGSSDPLISHPDPTKKLFRILNRKECALAKSIDPELVENRTEGQALSILGNGIIGSISEAFAYCIGQSILSLNPGDEEYNGLNNSQ